MRMIVLLCTFFLYPGLQGTEQKQWLITPEEADNLSLSKQGLRERGPADEAWIVTQRDGPQVRLVKPTVFKSTSPVDLQIRFEENKAPIDFKSIEVRAQRHTVLGFLGNLDITPRVRRHITTDGIDMPKQDMPTGRFRLRLRITDIEKRETTAALILEITDK